MNFGAAVPLLAVSFLCLVGFLATSDLGAGRKVSRTLLVLAVLHALPLLIMMWVRLFVGAPQ